MEFHHCLAGVLHQKSLMKAAILHCCDHESKDLMKAASYFPCDDLALQTRISEFLRDHQRIITRSEALIIFDLASFTYECPSHRFHAVMCGQVWVSGRSLHQDAGDCSVLVLGGILQRLQDDRCASCASTNAHAIKST